MESELEKEKQSKSPLNAADFEQAIESTGYGKFNYLLLLIAMPCCFSSVFETTTMSLILPSAECDLNLSLADKGILNAITYGAWIIIPNPIWNIQIVEDFLELHTWQSFLLVCASPSILSGVLIVTLLPESPKFLMSRGRNDEALKIFIKIHRMNNGSLTEYPIKHLVEERAKKTNLPVVNGTSSSKFFNGIRGGFSQMSKMLEPTHFRNACLVYTIQFCILIGLNTFRLWIVQIFAIIKEYEDEFSFKNVSNDANLCTMIEFKVNRTQHTIIETFERDDAVCEANLDGEMFYNSMLISVIQLGLYIMASSMINAVGNKKLLIFGLLISGSCGIGLYWAKDSTATLLLAAGYISISSICSTTLVSSIVSMFPTSTRTMNVSLAMMFGRTGAIIGNLVFPWLMSLGCFPPFAMIGLTALVCSFICILIPNTTKNELN